MNNSQVCIQENAALHAQRIELILDPFLVFDPNYTTAWNELRLLHPAMIAVIISGDHWLTQYQMSQLEEGHLNILSSLVGFTSYDEQVKFWGDAVMRQVFQVIAEGYDSLVNLVYDQTVVPEVTQEPEPQVQSEVQVLAVEEAKSHGQNASPESLANKIYGNKEDLKVGGLTYDGNHLFLSFKQKFVEGIGIERLMSRLTELQCNVIKTDKFELGHHSLVRFEINAMTQASYDILAGKYSLGLDPLCPCLPIPVVAEVVKKDSSAVPSTTDNTPINHGKFVTSSQKSKASNKASDLYSYLKANSKNNFATWRKFAHNSNILKTTRKTKLDDVIKAIVKAFNDGIINSIPRIKSTELVTFAI